ncbi:MAG: PilZ domain-containing protein [Candidatus Eremiobacteraeota bacterium]|nr:PilZ domain-containing protein [Candidatus Eremiobacteraeota bacterium]
MTEESTGQELWNYEERRTEARKKISLKKTFPAEILIDDPQKCYLYIVDISRGGMKVMTELAFPDHRAFILRLYLDEEAVEFAVEKVWHRQVVGYMNAMGLKFIALSQKALNIIENFVAKYSIDTSKRIIKPNKMINLQIMRHDEWVPFYAYLLTLGPQGFEFTSDYEFPEGEEFPLRFFIAQGQPPIEVSAKILFIKEITLGRKKGWMEFVEITEQNRLRLLEHLDKTLQGELPSNIMAPIEGYVIDFIEEETKKKKKKDDHKKFQKIMDESSESDDPSNSDWKP